MSPEERPQGQNKLALRSNKATAASSESSRSSV